MIRTIVDLRVTGGKPGTTHRARAGDVFPIGILLAVTPRRRTAVAFDTILIDVVFNSGTRASLHIDPDERPFAGEIVGDGRRVVDALAGTPIKPGRLTDSPPLSGGTPMAMGDPNPTSQVIGPYRRRTGLAGFVSKVPIELVPGAAPRAFAYGMVEARLNGRRAATTSIWATGYALLGDEPVAIVPGRSVVHVTAG